MTRDLKKQFFAGILALLVAIPIGFAIYYVNRIWAGNPERAVKVVGGMFALIALLPLAVYVSIRNKEASLKQIGLIVIGTVSALLAASYFFQTGFYVFFPADVFIWSESDYVNDILKFQQGYPIFTANVNNESFTYPPGSQLLTYFLALIAGQANSVAAYRVIQVGYTVLAAIVAFLCCRRLVKNVLPNESSVLGASHWGIVWLVGFFLIATNLVSNPFSHLLHNDALSQLLTVTAYFLLLEYDACKDKKILWLMALIPAVGFWVKQSLIIWAFLYLIHLLIFDQPRSFKKVFGFAAASFGGILVSIAIGYMLWKQDFIYWCFTVLGSHGVSPLRSFRSLLDIWEYFAVGMIGGLVLMQFAGLRKLLGPWLIWLILISSETYTSGVAWMLNHIGPGCLIAGVWFWAGIGTLSTKLPDSTVTTAGLHNWLRVGVIVAVICLMFSGFGFVRVPVQPFDYKDAERYVGQIEREFAGQPAKRTLLDFGTWTYLPEGVVMKDRAPTIGERGYSQTGDFSGVLGRVRSRYYGKILVRNFESPDFWYDHELWTKSSGIRQALIENYKVAGSIKAVEGFEPKNPPYGLSEVSILVPRTE